MNNTNQPTGQQEWPTCPYCGKLVNMDEHKYLCPKDPEGKYYEGSQPTGQQLTPEENIQAVCGWFLHRKMKEQSNVEDAICETLEKAAQQTAGLQEELEKVKKDYALLWKASEELRVFFSESETENKIKDARIKELENELSSSEHNKDSYFQKAIEKGKQLEIAESKVNKLIEIVEGALTQLRYLGYLDSRFSTGSTPALITQIQTKLDKLKQ